MNIFPYYRYSCPKRKVVNGGHMDTDENKADSHHL